MTTMTTHRILRTVYSNTPEDGLQVKEHLKRAARGAIPNEIREMMSDHGWGILHGTSSGQEKEKAKLLISYSWWARARDGGIPEEYFEEFMLDHLEYLDRRSGKDSGDELCLDKWKKFG